MHRESYFRVNQQYKDKNKCQLSKQDRHHTTTHLKSNVSKLYKLYNSHDTTINCYELLVMLLTQLTSF